MKKKVSLLLVALLIGLSLIGCNRGGDDTTPDSGDTSPDSQQPLPDQLSGTFTVWHAYQTGSAEEATFAEIVAKVEADNPGLDVEVLQIPFDDIFDKYMVDAAAGGGPDMFVGPNDDLWNWATSGLVEDLTPYLDDSYLAPYVEVAVEGMKVDGRLYGIPESAKAVALYYNQTLLDAPPETTEELLEAVKAGKGLTYYQGTYHIFGWYGAFGATLFDENNRCVLDETGGVEALQYLLDLKAAGALFDTDYSVAEAPFRQGEVAMFVNGPWALADYKDDLGDNLGVAPMPAGPGGPARPFNGIDGFYINVNSRDIPGAVKLGLLFTNQESSQLYTDGAGHVPIRTDVTAQDPLVTAFAKASENGYPRPQNAEFFNFWTPFDDMLVKVMEGASLPEEAITEACTAVNAANGK